MLSPIRLDITWPQLQVTLHMPELSLDAREALGDIGLKPVGEIMRERAQRGVDAAVEYIGTVAREGDRMAQVEVSDNVIAELAREKWPDTRELNVDVAPKHRVDVRLESGRVDALFTPGRVRVDLPHTTGTGRHGAKRPAAPASGTNSGRRRGRLSAPRQGNMSQFFKPARRKLIPSRGPCNNGSAFIKYVNPCSLAVAVTRDLGLQWTPSSRHKIEDS